MSAAAPPPPESEIVALAEQALAFAGREAQATAAWEWTPESGGRWLVEVVSLAGGRVGIATGRDMSEAALRALAEAAVAAAAGGPEGLAALPSAGPGRGHQGYDPAVLGLEPRAGRRAGLARTAVASSRGVRAFEQRSFVALGHPDGPEAAAPSASGLDGPPAALAPASGEVADPPAGELPVVLGAAAVAALLDALRPAFGRPGTLPAGTRVAAATISVSDSPRFSGTLPRSYDVHGVPRQPVPLIQDGVAHRLVSVATGHAVRAGHAEAAPAHLVLVGGGAGDEAELAAPVALGAYLPVLDRAFLVEDGRVTLALSRGPASVDPLAVLASTQALTARQVTIPGAGGARTIGATVCPALRAGSGVAF
jgi:hypothetical protein